MRGLFSLLAAYAVVIPFRGQIGGSTSRKMVDSDVFNRASLSPHWIDAEIVDPMAEAWKDADSIDDGCIGCPRAMDKSVSGDCNRCSYFLETVNKLIANPVPEQFLAPAKVSPVNRAAPVLAPALTPNQAAKAFVTYLRETGRHGQYQVGPLRAEYQKFCAMTSTRTTAENHLRSAMLRIPGVSKEKIWHGSGKDHKRDVFWIIQPDPKSETKLETVAETVVAGRFPHLKDKIPTLPSRRQPSFEKAA